MVQFIQSLFLIRQGTSEILAERHYGVAVSREICTRFHLLCSKYAQPTEVPPLLLIDGHVLSNVTREGTTFIAVTLNDVNSLVSFQFLSRLASLFHAYFGSSSPEAIRGNITKVYQIFEEVCDGGMPINCELNLVAGLVSPTGVRVYDGSAYIGTDGANPTDANMSIIGGSGSNTNRITSINTGINANLNITSSTSVMSESFLNMDSEFCTGCVMNPLSGGSSDPHNVGFGTAGFDSHGKSVVGAVRTGAAGAAGPKGNEKEKIEAVVEGQENIIVGKKRREINAVLPSEAVSAVSWRPTGVKYNNEEFYIDMIEDLKVVVNSDGRVVYSGISGHIFCNCLLSGAGPNVTLRFKKPEVIEDASFHPCVRYKIWNERKCIAMIPPDGRFKLMSYRPTRPKVSELLDRLPIKVRVDVFKGKDDGRNSFKDREKLRIGGLETAVTQIPIGISDDGVSEFNFDAIADLVTYTDAINSMPSLRQGSSSTAATTIDEKIKLCCEEKAHVINIKLTKVSAACKLVDIDDKSISVKLPIPYHDIKEYNADCGTVATCLKEADRCVFWNLTEMEMDKPVTLQITLEKRKDIENGNIASDLEIRQPIVKVFFQYQKMLPSGLSLLTADIDTAREKVTKEVSYCVDNAVIEYRV